MPLEKGAKLGPYEIVGNLGAGGMGEVYRALDPRLGREVAIKVSAERFNERFEREARAVAALNHPNICTLFDVGPNYLVMELVEGPTLDNRLDSGALSMTEATSIARQIADALEAAHEKGIVHRDLKPANIKIKPDGNVKVLDFGLAKVEQEQTESSATVSMGHTTAGTILGTAGYMSPEQARGKPVDKRADIWAFGVVFYEMVTGIRTFQGDTLSDSLAAILTKEPDWSKAPLKAQPLLHRCLEKEPRRRLRDIGDAMALLEAAPEALPETPAPVAAAPATPPARAHWLWPAAATLFLLALAGISVVHFRETPPAADPVTFKVTLPPKIALSASGVSAISPDGRTIAFFAISQDGVRRLWIRSLNAAEARALPETDVDSRNPTPPFWSPDSRFLAYSNGKQLKKVDLAGGPPQTICDDGCSDGVTGTWSRDGVIVFAVKAGMMQVPATGGKPSLVTRREDSRKEVYHLHPFFLPDGKRFLYSRIADKADSTGVYLASLDSKPENQDLKPVLSGVSNAVLVPAYGPNPNRLLFPREDTLYTQEFDLGRGQVAGDAIRVAEHVGFYNNFAEGLFSASANGTLVYKPTASTALQLTLFDRKGNSLGTIGDPGRIGVVALANDGSRAAVSEVDAGGNEDIWIHDLGTGAKTRFTFTQGSDRQPVWSPDRTKIAWGANRDGKWQILQRASNGGTGEEVLYESPNPTNLSEWSKDGKFIFFHNQANETDTFVLPVSGSRQPVMVAGGPGNQFAGHLSPDSRWVIYMSNESGRNEIYAQGFDPVKVATTGAKFMISKGTLGMHRWRSDGKEIVYLAPDGNVMSVDVTTTPVFHPGEPKPLFQMPAAFMKIPGNPGALADMTADGNRFLVGMPAGGGADELTVLLNWPAGLNQPRR